MKTAKNCLFLQLTLKVEDRTLAGHVHQRAEKTGKCLRCLRAHTHSLIFMWKCSRSDSQMIYDALNASAASVPPVLMSSSPGRLSCSRLSWGHIEKRVAHTPPKGKDIPVWHVCPDAVHICAERDCEGGKDALPLFAHLPGCHLGYCSVLLASWHTSTATALAHDLSGESAGMLEHVQTSGKGRKMSPVYHDDSAPSHRWSHWPRSSDWIKNSNYTSDLLSSQKVPFVCLEYDVTERIEFCSRSIWMEWRMNTGLEVRGLPEGTPRVQWDLWFSLSCRIYSHRHLRFTASPRLRAFEEREDPTHERGELSPPPLYLRRNYSTFLLPVILMVISSHLKMNPFSRNSAFQHHFIAFCSHSWRSH